MLTSLLLALLFVFLAALLVALASRHGHLLKKRRRADATEFTIWVQAGRAGRFRAPLSINSTGLYDPSLRVDFRDIEAMAIDDKSDIYLKLGPTKPKLRKIDPLDENEAIRIATELSKYGQVRKVDSVAATRPYELFGDKGAWEPEEKD